MILFHGSNTDIAQIELSKCRPNKDFGKGFYLTTIREQAVRMAQRVARMYGGSPTLNIYDFDNSADKLGTLNIRHFDSPSVEWAKFVITNRNATKLKDPQEDSNIDGRRLRTMTWHCYSGSFPKEPSLSRRSLAR